MWRDSLKSDSDSESHLEAKIVGGTLCAFRVAQRTPRRRTDDETIDLAYNTQLDARCWIWKTSAAESAAESVVKSVLLKFGWLANRQRGD